MASHSRRRSRFFDNYRWKFILTLIIQPKRKIVTSLSGLVIGNVCYWSSIVKISKAMKFELFPLERQPGKSKEVFLE